MKWKASEIKASKKEALDKIISFLEYDGDIDSQFDNKDGSYHSSNKFIVSWKVNYKSMPSEESIDKVDLFYSRYSGGAKCIHTNRSLFHEKQKNAFASIERALLEVGMGFIKDPIEKKEFWDKYVVRYNERLKNEKVPT